MSIKKTISFDFIIRATGQLQFLEVILMRFRHEFLSALQKL